MSCDTNVIRSTQTAWSVVFIWAVEQTSMCLNPKYRGSKRVRHTDENVKTYWATPALRIGSKMGSVDSDSALTRRLYKRAGISCRWGPRCPRSSLAKSYVWLPTLEYTVSWMLRMCQVVHGAYLVSGSKCRGHRCLRIALIGMIRDRCR